MIDFAATLADCGFTYKVATTIGNYRLAMYDEGQRILGQLWPSDRPGAFWLAILNVSKNTLDGRLTPLSAMSAIREIDRYAVGASLNYSLKPSEGIFEAHPWFSAKNEPGWFGKRDPEDVGVPGIKQFLTEFPFCQPRAEFDADTKYKSTESVATAYGSDMGQLEVTTTNNTAALPRLTIPDISKLYEQWKPYLDRSLDSMRLSDPYSRGGLAAPAKEEAKEPEPLCPYLTRGRKIEL